MNTFFKTKKDLIKKEIAKSIATQKQSAKSDYVWSEDALQRFEDFTISGKMIRGLLVVLAAGESTKQIHLDAVKIGAALEMMHSGILVHDDIMDRDVLRRGKPTIHTQYAELNKLSSKSENLHYGEGMAICVGIIAYFLAFNKFGEVKTATQVPKLIELFSSEMSLLGLGQMDDLYTAASNASTEQDCLRIYEQKTGRYTFGLPLLAGLTLGGKYSKAVEKQVQNLAKSLGIIFQLRDDYLGVFGNELTTGKSVGGDIRERKKTWLYFHLLKNVTKQDAKKISELYNGNKVMTKSEQQWVLAKMIQAEIPRLVEQELHHQQTKALALLQKLPFDTTQVQVMKDLINYLVDREK